MSLIERRAEIAACLSTVTGVRGFPYRPVTPKTGDAWPLLSALDRDDGLAFQVTWRVLVFLPQDEQKASVWIDEHHEQLVDGLLPVGFVDRIEPVALAAGTGDQYALQLTMRGE